MVPEQHGIGDIEQVVAGDAQVDRAGVLRPHPICDHAFVIGIDLGFALIGRLGPAVPCRLDAFQRQVGAFDETHFDRCASTLDPPQRPGGQLPLHRGRVR